MKNKAFYITALFMGMALLSYGQQNWEKPEQGEIEDAQVVIQKDRKITLPTVGRNFEKITAIQQNADSIPLDFQVKSIKPYTPLFHPQLRVLMMQPEPLEKLYGNQVKVGVGSYQNTMAELYLSNKRNKHFQYGLHGLHDNFGKGAKDERNSAEGMQYLALYGSTFSKQATLNMQADYQRNSTYYFGYPDSLTEVDRDTIQHVLHHFSLQAMLRNNDARSKFDYHLGMQFQYFKDNQDLSESLFSVDGLAAYQFNDTWGAALPVKGGISKLKSGLGDNARNYITFVPQLSYQLDKLKLSGGLNVTYEDDTLNGDQKIHIYPDLVATYPLSGTFKMALGFRGRVKPEFMQDRAYTNLWFGPSIVMAHTIVPLELYGDVSGSFTDVVGFKAGFAYSKMKGQQFWVNNPLNTSEYVNAVANKTSLFHLYGEFSANTAHGFHLDVRADYNGYDTPDMAAAYFLPAYSIRAHSSYFFYQKIKASLSFENLGNMQAMDLRQNGALVNLDNIYNIDVGLQYFFSKRTQLGLSLENIANQKFERYLYYLQRGITFQANFTYVF